MDPTRSIEPEESPTSGPASASNYADNNSIASHTEDSCSPAASDTFEHSNEGPTTRQQIEPTLESPLTSIELDRESHPGQYLSAQKQSARRQFNEQASHNHASPNVDNNAEIKRQQAFERLPGDEVKQQQQFADINQSLQMKARQGCHRAASLNANEQKLNHQPNQGKSGECDEVKHVDLFGVKIVALIISSKERLCLAQISNTLLKEFSYNEIHNRRVALGITCVQCTPIQLEMLRRAGAMPSSSRRCGMITMREAERLCRSFLAEEQPPELPEHFYFTVAHRVNYGCKGRFIPSRYISSRAKCIECFHCGEFYSPNKFIFHSHKQPDATDCNPPDSPNINSWRKHINLDWSLEHSQEIKYAWEDVKSLFNGGTRRRASVSTAAAGSGGGGGAGGGGGGGGGDGSSSMGSDVCLASQSGDNRSEFSEDRQTTNGAPDDADKLSAANKRRKVAHSIEDLSSPMELDGRGSTRAPQRGPILAGAHLSQSERRKLPMSWPANSRAGLNSCANRSQQLAINQQSARLSSRLHRPTGGPNIPPRRMSPCNPADRDPNKRLLTTTNWHQPRLNSAAAAERHQQSAGFEQHQDQLTSQFNSFSNANQFEKRPDHSQSQSILMQQKRNSRMGDELLQGTSDISMAKLPPQAPMNCASQTSLLSTGQPGNPSSFVYSQLYSQLLQSQLNQQQARQPQAPALLPMDALRHHIWSSLLANLHCNPTALEAAACDGGSAVGPQPTNLPNYNIGNPVGQQPRAGSFLAGFNQPLGDPANLSISPHLTPSGFNSLSTMMQMYGAPTTGQVGIGDPSAASMFTINDNGNDGCK